MSTFTEVESIVIRFAGDSGDGMQLTGTQFTNTAAVFGNDVSTLPDFPAEIRAPVGTIAGVSGFQVNFSNHDVLTPGDAPQILVAMNPAALKANLFDLQRGGTVIVNKDAFTNNNLKKAKYESNPLENGTLKGYDVHAVPLTTLNRNALADIEGFTAKQVDLCKNFFALGLVFWMFDRPLETSMNFIAEKFAKRPKVVEANQKALQAGYNYGDTMLTFQSRYRIQPAQLPPGKYRQINGNEALAMGLVTAAQKANKPLVYNSYPITPASELLHQLASLKNFNVRTFQAEDEIAAMGSAIGAAFGGVMAVTGTSGPGLALKSEGLNLAMTLELPLIVVDVQRAGPSTGMPTKTEQADLLQAMYGRNGESPLPIIAPATPSDCFNTAIEAYRFAVRAMVPVIILSDGYLATSAEPWRIPNPDDIPPIKVIHPTASNSTNGLLPYKRNPETLGRPWVLPGTSGLEHRIGGLSKQPNTGSVSYLPDENQQMINERASKVARLADIIPPQSVTGPAEGELLILTWGSTYGAAHTAALNAQKEGLTVAHTHLRHINPFPPNLDELLLNYQKILVPEMNMGQLVVLLRNRFSLLEFISYPKVKGRPFTIGEIANKIHEILGAEA